MLFTKFLLVSVPSLLVLASLISRPVSLSPRPLRIFPPKNFLLPLIMNLTSDKKTMSPARSLRSSDDRRPAPEPPPGGIKGGVGARVVYPKRALDRSRGIPCFHCPSRWSVVNSFFLSLRQSSGGACWSGSVPSVHPGFWVSGFLAGVPAFLVISSSALSKPFLPSLFPGRVLAFRGPVMGAGFLPLPGFQKKWLSAS